MQVNKNVVKDLLVETECHQVHRLGKIYFKILKTLAKELLEPLSAISEEFWRTGEVSENPRRTNMSPSHPCLQEIKKKIPSLFICESNMNTWKGARVSNKDAR